MWASPGVPLGLAPALGRLQRLGSSRAGTAAAPCGQHPARRAFRGGPAGPPALQGPLDLAQPQRGPAHPPLRAALLGAAGH